MNKMDGLLRWRYSKEPACQCRRHKRCKGCGFDPWVRKIPWRRAWQPTPVFLSGETHGQRNLVGYIQSMGCQRVGHNEVTEHTHTHTHTHTRTLSRHLILILLRIPYKRRRQWHPTPVLLPGKSHGWRSLEGCSPWGR